MLRLVCKGWHIGIEESSDNQASSMSQDAPILTAVFEPAPEGGFTCTFEELPDVFSEGETLDEARANLFDALELILGYHRDQARQRATNDRTEGGIVREIFALQRAA